MSAGYAQALKSLIGRRIEIYQGVEHETLLKAEKEFNRKSVIRGVLKDVIEECVVLECSHGGSFVTVFINAWSIYSAMEESPNITLHNIYDASDSTYKRGAR